MANIAKADCDQAYILQKRGLSLLEGERLDQLDKKGLFIIQKAAAPCFSLDALILAHFAFHKLTALAITKNKKQIAEEISWKIGDFGTGTGIISILLADALPQSSLYAWEIMGEMAEMAQRSLDFNGLSARVQIFNEDLRANNFPKASLDLIISNPPFFPLDKGRISQEILWAAARSELYCTLQDIFCQSGKLLRDRGLFFLIHRPERLAEILDLSRQYKIQPNILRFIQPFADQNANLLLFMGRKNGKEALQVENPLIIYQSAGLYTQEAGSILADKI